MPVTTQKKPELARVTTTATPIPEKPVIEVTALPERTTVTITLPVFDWPEGYVSRNTNCWWNQEQAINLRRIQLGLERQEAQLKDGKYVSNGVDALRYILENISIIQLG